MQIYRPSAPLMNKQIGPTSLNYQCDSPSLTAGIFVIVFLIRCVITRGWEYGCYAYSLLSLMCWKQREKFMVRIGMLFWRRQRLLVCLPTMHLFHPLLPFSSCKAHLTVTLPYIWLMRAAAINTFLARVSAWYECELICSLPTTLQFPVSAWLEPHEGSTISSMDVTVVGCSKLADAGFSCKISIRSHVYK